MNKYLSKLNEWNLSAMEERFEELFKNIVKIWKRPEKFEDKDIEKVTFVLKGAASLGTGKLLTYEKFELFKGSGIIKGNYKVSSPSVAASLILGRNANGWIEWKIFEDKLLNNLQNIFDHNYFFLVNILQQT